MKPSQPDNRWRDRLNEVCEEIQRDREQRKRKPRKKRVPNMSGLLERLKDLHE